MSVVGPISAAFDYLSGAASGLIDAALSSVPLPGIGAIPDVPLGDGLEPDASERAGAAMARTLLEGLGVLHAPVDVARSAGRLPIVAQVTWNVSDADATAPQTLQLSATAQGADWLDRDRPSGELAVFVDGRYAGTTRVLVEKGGSASVALGVLGAGSHVVELRDATGLAAGTPVQCVRVASASVHAEHGEAALVARHAPIIETRGDSRAAHGSDAPLLLSPTVQHNADGTQVIRYYVLLSNEDGGTPIGNLLDQYGRPLDFELAYEVVVDAAGNRIGARYQGPMHGSHAFDGRFEGDRPVLRIATNNNNFSANVHGGGVTRFVDAPLAAVAERADLPRDAQLLRSQPWVLAVAGKELLREGRVLAAGAASAAAGVASAATATLKRVFDPRRYVYLQGVHDVRGGAVDVLLAGGRSVRVALAKDAGTGDNDSTAIVLPQGVDASQVVGLRGAVVGALLVDADWTVRDVPVSRAAAAAARAPRPSHVAVAATYAA